MLKWFLLSILWAGVAVANETAFQKVPPEFYIAEIPGLARSGEHRVSWGFLRPPYLWYQGQQFDLSKQPFPQWDIHQFPAALAPVAGRKVWVRWFDADKKPIETLLLDKPVFEDRFDQAPVVPAYYQVAMTLNPSRAIVTTDYLPWISKKKVIQCEAVLKEGESIATSRKINSCLDGIRGIADSTDAQWFASFQWPHVKGREETRLLSGLDREFKAKFRKHKHFYVAQNNKDDKFRVIAGVTQYQMLPKIGVRGTDFKRQDFLAAVPTREEKERKIHEQSLPGGEAIEVFAFAADAIEARSISSPAQLEPRVQLQFVEAPGELQFRKTEFVEARTGLRGLLRPWQLDFFATSNQITSNRGEQDEILNLPGLEVAYKTNFWKLTPTVIFDSGSMHPNSTLGISELQVTLRRPIFETRPEWQLSGGLHQYSLAGKNPGSTRLGRMDSFALGLTMQTRAENFLLKGRAHMLLSEVSGFESRVEWGRFLPTLTDLNSYVGFSLGYARYAGKGTNQLRVIETFTEDRISVGLHIGFVGADYF